MGKKKKLERFAENETFHNMFQVSFTQLMQEPFPLKGKWNEQFFHNQNPVVLELGCGKGEYTVGLAREFPGKNFIGVDIKGARMWKGCKISQEENLQNVAFLRTRIEMISHIFHESEVDEIWITFPDPQPGIAREKKRLTSPSFLNRYRAIGKKDCVIHLKTDDDNLYHFTLDVIRNENLDLHIHTDNLHEDRYAGAVTAIKTHYEKIWLEKGLTIKYLRYSLFPKDANN